MRTVPIFWAAIDMLPSFPNDKCGKKPPVSTDEAPSSRRGPACDVRSRLLDSGVLFAGSSEVVISHGPEIYRLRLTKQNRLILTK